MSFKTYLFLGFFANPSQLSAQTVEMTLQNEKRLC